MCLKYLYNICDVLRRQEIFIIDEKRNFCHIFQFFMVWSEKMDEGEVEYFQTTWQKQLKYDKLLASQDVAGRR